MHRAKKDDKFCEEEKCSFMMRDLEFLSELVSDGVLVLLLHAEFLLDDLELLMQHVLAVLLLYFLLHLTRSMMEYN